MEKGVGLTCRQLVIGLLVVHLVIWGVPAIAWVLTNSPWWIPLLVSVTFESGFLIVFLSPIVRLYRNP